jgi:hypothetical protein
MTEAEDTIVVFTARSPERIVREGGSQAWVLNAARAKGCTWLVCTQNRHNADHEFSDATEPHGAGFLLGKISAIRKSQAPGDEDRWLIAISEFARIDMPDLWDHGRNPVRYMSLAQLGIDPKEAKFEPMPQGVIAQPPAGAVTASGAQPVATLTIAEAKRALAAAFGVKPDAVEITIRG